MLAIVSDIHANLEALQAVLADIARHRVEAIYCLGDTVGYGPNPRECLDIVMQWPLVLLGNFEQAALADPSQLAYSPCALRSLEWARSELNTPVPDQQSAERRWQFLKDLPHLYRKGFQKFVHGTPRNPVDEYVFPEDIYHPRKLDRIFARVERYCFQGHTHIPGIFTEDRQFHSPEELAYVYRLDGRKTLCNVGSVGQPRDGDWRACYALLDGDTIRFRRVEYDIDTTVRTIWDIDDLDDFLGDRLRDGR